MEFSRVLLNNNLEKLTVFWSIKSTYMRRFETKLKQDFIESGRFFNVCESMESMIDIHTSM